MAMLPVAVLSFYLFMSRPVMGHPPSRVRNGPYDRYELGFEMNPRPTTPSLHLIQDTATPVLDNPASDPGPTTVSQPTARNDHDDDSEGSSSSTGSDHSVPGYPALAPSATRPGSNIFLASMVPTTTSLDLRPGRSYCLRTHITTSADGSSDTASGSEVAESNASQGPTPDLRADEVIGPATPPAPIYTEADLRARVLHALGSLWDHDEDIMAQRVAQEIRDLSVLFRFHRQGALLARLAAVAAVYRVDNMDIGDILTPWWSQWTVALVADAERCVQQPEPDSDDSCLMGFKGKKGNVRISPRRRRHRSRTPAEERPWRQAAREEQERREEGRRPDPVDPHEHRPWRSTQRVPQDTSANITPAPSSTRRIGTAPSSLAADTLSLNRHTWRSLLCMEPDGPGVDLNRTLNDPLDAEQMDNVQATAENMGPGERLAFVASLMQFLMEVGHQVASHLVVTASDSAEQTYADNEGHSLMQTSTTPRPKPEDGLQQIQMSLEKGMHKRQRSSLLVRRLLDEPVLTAHAGLETVLAMLLVYRDDNHADMDETTSEADKAWVEHYVTFLKTWVQTASTVPVEYVDTPPAGVGLDSEAHAPRTRSRSRGSGSRSCTDPPSRLQEEARRYREWEEWAVQHEMTHPPPIPRQELLLDVGAKIQNVMHHVTLPLPTNNLLNVDLCLRIRRPDTSEDVPTRDDVEDASLMQRAVPPALSKVSGILKMLIPEARREIAWRLVHDLRERMRLVLHRLLHQLDGITGAQVLYAHHEGMPIGEEVDPREAQRVVDAMVSVLDDPADHAHAVGAEADLPGLVCRLQLLTQDSNSGLDVRRRRTASSSNTRMPATPSSAVDMANFMREQIRLITFAHPDTQGDILRQATIVMTERLQLLATQMHALVLVVADLLPQPCTETPVASASRSLGATFARDLLDELSARFHCDGTEVVRDGSFGVTELLPLLTGLNPMIGEVMALLEDGDCLFSSSEDDVRMDGSVSDRMATYLGGAGIPGDVTQEVPVCMGGLNMASTQIDDINAGVDAEQDAENAGSLVPDFEGQAGLTGSRSCPPPEPGNEDGSGSGTSKGAGSAGVAEGSLAVWKKPRKGL